MVLGDRPQGAIYVAWSGHSKTSRVQGMLVKPTAAKVEDDEAWARAMQTLRLAVQNSSRASLAFRNCLDVSQAYRRPFYRTRTKEKQKRFFLRRTRSTLCHQKKATTMILARQVVQNHEK